MAETLDVSQMLANEYEQKRQFRWLIAIDSIDAFTARTAKRPSKKFESTVIDYINQKSYFAGKGEWAELDFEFNDPISPSASQKIMNWLRLVHDDPTGRMGYKDFYTKTLTLKLLDPAGTVVEQWKGVNMWPMNVDFGGLDYKESEVVTVKCTFRADRYILEF